MGRKLGQTFRSHHRPEESNCPPRPQCQRAAKLSGQPTLKRLFKAKRGRSNGPSHFWYGQKCDNRKKRLRTDMQGSPSL